MLRKIVEKKNAALFVTALITVLLLSLLWPLRLFKHDIPFVGGEITQSSGEINDGNDAGEYFAAQYPHLQSVRIYISGVSNGRAFKAQLFHQGKDGTELTAEELVRFPQDVPDYVTIPVDADLVPGDTYILLLRGIHSSFTAGLTGTQEGDSAPLYLGGFYQDTSLSGLHTAMDLTYRVPLQKGRTLAAAAAVLAAGVLAAFAAVLRFRKRPEKNTLVPVLTVMQYVLTPVILTLGAAAGVAIWPLKLFDTSLLDIVFYEAGTAVFVFSALYGLWHKRPAFTEREREMSFGGAVSSVRHLLNIICIALLFKYSADYMNALSDITHDNSQNAIIILLCLVMLIMGDLSWVLNGWTVLTAAGASAAAILWYHAHKEGPQVRYYLEHNSVFRSSAAAFVFAAVTAVSVIVMLVRQSGCRKKLPKAKLLTVLPLSALLVWMLIFRGPRQWVLVMAPVIALLYARYLFFTDRKLWLRDVSCGIALNFVCSVLYSMLHRYYIAYEYNRFSMQFHTVTVTAYYLLIVSAVSVTLLLSKLRAYRGLPLRQKLPYIWKEVLFFGFTASYMLMSLTRAGIGGLFLFCVFSAVALCGGKKARIRGPLAALASMLLIVLLTFPAVFTGQRLVSTVADRPQRFEEIEPYNDSLLRNVRWDSRWFMNLEIFIRDFGDRIVGGGTGSKLYFRLGWNGQRDFMDDRERIMGEIEDDIAQEAAASEGARKDELEGQEEAMLSGDGQESSPVQATGTEGSLDNGDLSNGRVELWKRYLQQLRLKGHDEMGVELLDGQIAVHAHNVYLQAAYDFGIPGGILFLGFTVLTLAGTWIYYVKNRAWNLYGFVPFLTASGFMITGLVEWIFQFCNPYTLALFLMIAPVLFQEPEDAVEESAG